MIGIDFALEFATCARVSRSPSFPQGSFGLSSPGLRQVPHGLVERANRRPILAGVLPFAAWRCSDG
jgi:hypothetical protein